MSSNVVVRTNAVTVRASDGVTVRQTKPTLVAAGVSGPAGPVWAGHYGSFYSSVSQSLAAANTPQAVTFNGTYTADGVSVVSGSRLTLAHVGTYSLSFIAQLHNLSNEPASLAFWLRLNGSDYAASTMRVDLSARKSAGVAFESSQTITFVGTSSAPNDYVEIWWYANTTDVTLQAHAAGTDPVTPSAPSVVVGLGQIG